MWRDVFTHIRWDDIRHEYCVKATNFGGAFHLWYKTQLAKITSYYLWIFVFQFVATNYSLLLLPCRKVNCIRRILYFRILIKIHFYVLSANLSSELAIIFHISYLFSLSVLLSFLFIYSFHYYFRYCRCHNCCAVRCSRMAMVTWKINDELILMEIMGA